MLYSPSEVNLDRLTPTAPPQFAHTFVHTRGIRLHCVHAAHTAWGGLSDAPLVLLLHDAAGSWLDFAELIAPLSERGYRVVAVDLRGHGLSDKPPGAYDIRAIAGELAGLVATAGASRVNLVGLGAGATIAWAMAAHGKVEVSSIVSIHGGHPDVVRKELLRRPWRWGRSLFLAAGSHLPFVSHPLVPSIVPATVVRSDFPPNPTIRTMSFRISATWRPAVQLRRLSTARFPRSDSWRVFPQLPCLFLDVPARFAAAHGGAVAYVRGSGRGAQRGCRNPQARFPEETARIIDAFVRTVPTA